MAWDADVPLAANQIAADLAAINANWEYFVVDHGTDGQHTLTGFQGSQYAADAEASDTYVITLSPVPAAYFNGMVVNFKANTVNTGAATLNVNALGAKTIKKHHDQDLADGDIEAGQMVTVIYDGTVFQMQSQQGVAPVTDLVNDTTPQLGGELDAQAHSIGFTQQTATGDGTTTIDWKLGNKFKFTFGASAETFTFTAPTKPCNLLLVMVQDATGGRVPTWPATVKWSNATQPVWATAANKVNIATFYYDGTSYYGQGGINFA